MPRTALATTLVTLALLAGAWTLSHAPAPTPHDRASLSPLEMTAPTGLPDAPGDIER